MGGLRRLPDGSAEVAVAGALNMSLSGSSGNDELMALALETGQEREERVILLWIIHAVKVHADGV